jgi:hypothetical protein
MLLPLLGAPPDLPAEGPAWWLGWRWLPARSRGTARQRVTARPHGPVMPRGSAGWRRVARWRPTVRRTTDAARRGGRRRGWEKTLRQRRKRERSTGDIFFELGAKIYGAELGPHRHHASHFEPARHGAGRLDLWHRGVLARRHNLWRRVSGPKLEISHPVV